MAVSKSDDAAEGHVSGQANEPMSLPAHSLSSVQVAQELQTETTRGLSSDDAATRLAKYGPNNLGEEKGVNALEILIAQVANAMTLVSFFPPSFLYYHPPADNPSLRSSCSLSAPVWASSPGSKAASSPA